jgi:flagellin-like protein
MFLIFPCTLILLFGGNGMKRVNIRKDVIGVSPVIAVILMVAITVVLAGVLYVWVTGLSDVGKQKAPTTILKLESRDQLNSTTGQNLTILTHQSGDKVKWSDMKIQVSDDGGTFYIVTFGIEEPNLHIIMTKGLNVGEEASFEVLEKIIFQEGSENWDPKNDFYLKIIHTPSKSTMYEDRVNLD